MLFKRYSFPLEDGCSQLDENGIGGRFNWKTFSALVEDHFLWSDPTQCVQWSTTIATIVIQAINIPTTSLLKEIVHFLLDIISRRNESEIEEPKKIKPKQEIHILFDLLVCRWFSHFWLWVNSCLQILKENEKEIFLPTNLYFLVKFLVRQYYLKG